MSRSRQPASTPAVTTPVTVVVAARLSVGEGTGSVKGSSLSEGGMGERWACGDRVSEGRVVADRVVPGVPLGSSPHETAPSASTSMIVIDKVRMPGWTRAEPRRFPMAAMIVHMTQPPTGVLVLAATPIGRTDDASPRLADELRGADVVAAEDTRRLRRLTSDLGVEIPGRVVSYFEGNEHLRTDSLLESLLNGDRVVLVTDAGMPSVSDPGYRLVAAAVERGVTVTSVPGPSAVLTALAVSGLPVDRFCFEGFLPRKPGERTRRLSDLALEQRTLVFFEAPHRTHATLQTMAEVFGDDRRGAVCRELTKTHEEVRRGALSDLVAWAEPGVRGEVTIVLEGAAVPEPVTDPTTLAALVAEEEATGATRKEAILDVARRSGVPKRVVYDAVHRS